MAAVVSLTDGWSNPFTEGTDLTSISTATEAPKDVTKDMTREWQVREKERRKA